MKALSVALSTSPAAVMRFSALNVTNLVDSLLFSGSVKTMKMYKSQLWDSHLLPFSFKIVHSSNFLSYLSCCLIPISKQSTVTS